MLEAIKLGDVTVGYGQPALIIAEAGVNHNGDIKLARRLVREAKRVGANCVKFQTFKAERLVTEEAPKANYQLMTTDPQESQLEMLRKLELAPEVYRDLIVLCQAQNIMFLSTPYSYEDVDLLDKLNVPAFKLASIHIAEPYFLQYVARKGKPMIVSTGMATLTEVAEAVRAIRDTDNDQFVLLQCTTNYPSSLEDANLRAMETIQKAFNVLVGYSDHTQGDTACLAAAALGACVIEKHFTLDKSLPGPDHSSSADPVEFEQLVRRIREAEMVLGSGKKEPSKFERINAVGMRRSIVAKCRIPAGQIITEEMLTFKRPATGLRPALLPDLVGRVATCDIRADQALSWEMIGVKNGNHDL